MKGFAINHLYKMRIFNLLKLYYSLRCKQDLKNPNFTETILTLAAVVKKAIRQYVRDLKNIGSQFDKDVEVVSS